MRLSLLAVVAGLCLFVYALTVPPYVDEKKFTERYMALSPGQSKEYWALRDEMLTNRFRFQDYGVTVLIAGIVGLIALRKGFRQIKAPRARSWLAGLAIALPFLTVGGYVFDLFLAFGRGEFPHWADSMGIPLAGVPILLGAMLVWALAHLLFLRGTYTGGTPIAQGVSRKGNWYLLAVAALTALLICLTSVFGQYYYALPSVLWLYFYLSLAAGRIAANGT